jgi:hypothetical protein
MSSVVERSKQSNLVSPICLIPRWSWTLSVRNTESLIECLLDEAEKTHFFCCRRHHLPHPAPAGPEAVVVSDSQQENGRPGRSAFRGAGVGALRNAP